MKLMVTIDRDEDGVWDENGIMVVPAWMLGE